MSLGRLHFLVSSHPLERLKVSFRKVDLIAGLSEADRGLVQVLSRQRTLTVELLAALVEPLLRIEAFARSLDVEPGFLDCLRQAGTDGRLITRLCLLIHASVFSRSRVEVPILKERQQLAFAYAIAAVHIKLSHRSGDLGCDDRLPQCSQNSLSRDDALDRAPIDGNGLHGDNGLRLGRLVRATLGHCSHADGNRREDIGAKPRRKLAGIAGALQGDRRRPVWSSIWLRDVNRSMGQKLPVRVWISANAIR